MISRVVEVGHDHAVLHGVSADDAAGRHFEIENGIAGGRELVHELFGRGAAIERARVSLFQNHHATALDARVVGVHRGGDKVGEGNAGNEAAALVNLQHRFLAVFPVGHAHLAAHHAGVDAHVGDGLSQCEGAAPGLAIFTGLRRSGELLVAKDLLRRAALVNWRERQKSCQARSRRAAIHPRKLEGRETEREILRPDDESALFRLHEGRSDARAVEGVQHFILGRGPLVRVALAGRHHAGHGSARHAARRCHKHLQVEPIGKPPQDLPYRISGECEHHFRFRNCNCAHGGPPDLRPYFHRAGARRHVTRITRRGRQLVASSR